jgi:pyruvate/2-oxoglutarate dehydrogenase complex dihydrolipoamide acyltransferase (E2) component
MTTVTMPKESLVVADVKVTHWYKKEGDPVREGEPLLEVETIKAIADLPAPATGTLVRVLVQQGETVAIETPLAEIEA